MPEPHPDALPTARILTPADLEDPSRFVKIGAVPLLDAHQDEARGDVDINLLKLLEHNTNARARANEFAPVLLGHTVDGDDYPEDRQPECIGYGSYVHIGDYNGTPCLMGDIHIYRDKYDRLPSFPNRSVERMKGPSDELNWIDAISLLRKAPERSLGRLAYARPAGVGGLQVLRYARDLGPTLAALPPPLRNRAAEEYDHLAAQVQANLEAHAAGCERSRRRRSARSDLRQRLGKVIQAKVSYS